MKILPDWLKNGYLRVIHPVATWLVRLRVHPINLTSCTPPRAAALGLDAKVGMLQRPERVVLLSVPQAFFGLALNGWVLALIIIFLTVPAWITVVQRVAFVYHQTAPRAEAETLRFVEGEKPRWLRRRRSVSRPLLKGD